jgi:molybdopterin-guanine dinucleotide biosynthesis protein A
VAPDATEVIGAVMAGGRGTRLGAPKSTIELAGRPLLEYPLAAFSGASIQAVVVAKSGTPLPQLEAELWLEADEPAHPLCGIVTALERADGRAVLVCGCDMPFVSAALLKMLASSNGRLVVPRVGDHLHPVLARYDPVLLEPLRAALDERRPLQSAIADLEPRLIEESELRALGDPELLLFNVNEPGDLRRAEELLRGERQPGRAES